MIFDRRLSEHWDLKWRKKMPRRPSGCDLAPSLLDEFGDEKNSPIFQGLVSSLEHFLFSRIYGIVLLANILAMILANINDGLVKPSVFRFRNSFGRNWEWKERRLVGKSENSRKMWGFNLRPSQTGEFTLENGDFSHFKGSRSQDKPERKPEWHWKPGNLKAAGSIGDFDEIEWGFDMI